MSKIEVHTLNERVLEDDYPVYYDYFYVADGKVVQSDIQGTVARLKRDLNASEITNCDIFGRMEQEERNAI